VSNELHGVAVDVAAKLAKESVEAFGASLGGLLKRAKVEVKWGFSDYLEHTIGFASKVKILSSPFRPHALGDIYAPGEITIGERTWPDLEFFNEIRTMRQVVIVGPGGSGKSLLLRRLYLHIVSEQWSLLPAHIELLRWEFAEHEISIRDLLSNHFASSRLPHISDHIDLLGRRGDLALLLDGFDEIAASARPRFERALLDFVRQYPKCLVILTSRPASRFTHWPSFHEARIAPLKMDRALEIVRKTPTEPFLKKPVLEFLATPEGAQWIERANTPLFLGVLIVFCDGDFPDSDLFFYRCAAEALFRRHDQMKSPFTRTSYRGLGASDLEKVIDYFSLLSFLTGDHSWSYERTALMADRALEQYELGPSGQSLLVDMMETAGVLDDVHGRVTFTLEGFRAFFAARALVRTSQIEMFLNNIDDLHDRREVARLAYALEPHEMLRGWLGPSVEIIWRCSQGFEHLGDASGYARCTDALLIGGRLFRGNPEFACAVARLRTVFDFTDAFADIAPRGDAIRTPLPEYLSDDLLDRIDGERIEVDRIVRLLRTQAEKANRLGILS